MPQTSDASTGGLVDTAYGSHRITYRLAQTAARFRDRREARRGYPRLRAKFEQKHGYALNLDTPRTFSERMQLRKIRDRDPRFPRLVDKYLVRAYLDEVLGDGSADRLMVPVLAATQSFAELPASLWSRDVMLKGTHGSGMNIALPASAGAEARKRAARQFWTWLGHCHGTSGLEWAYWQLTPRILVEPLLSEGEMIDYRIYTFGGEPRYIRAQRGVGNDAQVGLYDPEWTPSPIRWTKFGDGSFERPAHLDRMLEIARQLGRGFDSLRVDFMVTERRFYLGELTIYDNSGLARFGSYDQDLAFADGWDQSHLGVD